MPPVTRRSSLATITVSIVLSVGTVTTISLVSSCSLAVHIEDKVTPPEAREGWAGPEAVEEASEIVATMPEFRIIGDAGDNELKDVRHWDAAKAVLGHHVPNYPQQVGDCVAFGVKNAVEYLQCNEIARGPPQTFRSIYPPYVYGTSRVQIGKGRLRGDGSVGAWAAKAVQQYGVLASDAPQAPKYSGSVARDWGRSGPPQPAIDEAKQWLVKTVAQVTTPEAVRDAICNGYPVTIASNFGSKNFDQKDGRLVARGNGSWNHQMCIIAYDGDEASGEKYFYVINSWGEKAHPAPLQGEPPGGFWITWAQCQKIVKQGDSFAFSGFDGFPAQDLDFRIFATVPTEKDPCAVSASALFSLAL
jgi:hypothetical protein